MQAACFRFNLLFKCPKLKHTKHNRSAPSASQLVRMIQKTVQNTCTYTLQITVKHNLPSKSRLCIFKITKKKDI